MDKRRREAKARGEAGRAYCTRAVSDASASGQMDTNSAKRPALQTAVTAVRIRGQYQAACEPEDVSTEHKRMRREKRRTRRRREAKARGELLERTARALSPTPVQVRVKE